MRLGDKTALTLLLLWVGGALALALFTPLLFSTLPSREMAGGIAGRMVQRMDGVAWIAFGGAFLCAAVPRLMEPQKNNLLDMKRLWVYTCATALVFCLASSFVVTPKLQALSDRLQNAAINQVEDITLRRQKAHRISRQFFFIRIILAGALAWGLTQLDAKPLSPKE